MLLAAELSNELQNQHTQVEAIRIAKIFHEVVRERDLPLLVAVDEINVVGEIVVVRFEREVPSDSEASKIGTSIGVSLDL